MNTLREYLEWIEANSIDARSSSRASAALLILDNAPRKNWAWITIVDPQRVTA